MAAETTDKQRRALETLAYDTLERLAELFPDDLRQDLDGFVDQPAYVERWDQFDECVWSYLNAIPAASKKDPDV